MRARCFSDEETTTRELECLIQPRQSHRVDRHKALCAYYRLAHLIQQLRQRKSSSDGLSDDSTAFWEGLEPSAAAITAITNTISQAMDSKDWTSGVTGAAPPDGCAWSAARLHRRHRPGD